MIESLFTKEHINGLRPQIQATVNSLLDALIREGGSNPVDFIEKFALPVPSYVSRLPPQIASAY
jgi:nitric oxide reductase